MYLAKDGLRAPVGATPGERIALHTRRDPATGCLIWMAAKHDARGYVRMGIDRRMVYVHCVAWALINGPVPPNRVLRHTCDTPSCVNADHLILGTQRENVADMFSRARQSDRRGEANNAAKVTATQAAAIRSERESGTPVADLATKYGICKTQVRNITSGTHWKADPCPTH